MTYFHSLTIAGFAATAISYGPARMGFGLFVPEFRQAFSMSTSAVGFVSSLGFLGFFLGLVVAQALLNRHGPAAPVLFGLLAATTGLTIITLAPGVDILAAGVFLSASSAGFAWTPFNDAVHRKIRDVDRPTALSEISTGTSVGIALAGLVALGMVRADLDWRLCWAFFAVASAAALFVNWRALRHVDKSADALPRLGWRSLFHVAAIPLFVIAFVLGTTSAIYISFAADHYASSGGVPGIRAALTPALVFIVYGLFGLAGFATQRAKSGLGLPWLIRLLMLAGALSLALVAAVPNSGAGLIASAGLQGINVMMTSAVLAFWSERLFPAFPSLGFTAALLATAAGSVMGPAIAGVVSDQVGAGAMFMGLAVLPAVVAVAFRDHHGREEAAGTDPE